MKHWMNKGNCQFDLLLGGQVQQVLGKMIDMDDAGCTILLATNGQEHAYTWAVVQHICDAP